MAIGCPKTISVCTTTLKMVKRNWKNKLLKYTMAKLPRFDSLSNFSLPYLAQNRFICSQIFKLLILLLAADLLLIHLNEISMSYVQADEKLNVASVGFILRFLKHKTRNEVHKLSI